MTNKILTHIALALGGPSSLPGRLKNKALARLMMKSGVEQETLIQQLSATADRLVS